MLTNDQLSGIIPVVVANKTAGGKRIIESKNAYILKVKQGDRQGVFATVKIDGDEVDRWIFAKDQEGDENFQIS